MLKKRKLLYLILSFWILVIFVSMFTLFLYNGTNIEKLYNQYPVYSVEQKDYILTPTKPKGWLRLQNISKYAKWAIVVSEDWAFYDHSGFDLNQIKLVFEESIEEKKLVRGASTITQQVVKNSFLSNERSLWRKLKEVILAVKLERLMEKNQILEIYLNLVELGPGIYGVDNASRFYFDKSASELTPKEGAFLAMLLPSPTRHSESFKKKELTSFAKNQINSILVKMRQAKIITEEEQILESEKKLSFEKTDLEINLEFDWDDSF